MKNDGYICNSCGKELNKKGEILQEDALIVRKEWGFFSGKDLEIHEFVVCEKCYDRWIEKMKIPVSVSIKKEVLGESL